MSNRTLTKDAQEGQKVLDEARRKLEDHPMAGGPTPFSAITDALLAKLEEEGRLVETDARGEPVSSVLTPAEKTKLPLIQMGVPPKEARMILTGSDRWGRKWEVGEAWKLLEDALGRTPIPGCIVLSGEQGTGKSAAACRALFFACQWTETLDHYKGLPGMAPAGYKPTAVQRWSPGRYVRAAEYVHLSPKERLDISKRKMIVLDDLGEEGEDAWKNDKLRHLFTSRDDHMENRGEVMIISGNMTPQHHTFDGEEGGDPRAEAVRYFSRRYGARAMGRMAEWGMVWIHVSQVMRRGSSARGEAQSTDRSDRDSR